MSETEYGLKFDAKPEPKCKHCKREKCRHQAKTFNCPTTHHQFTTFHQSQTYEPKEGKPT